MPRILGLWCNHNVDKSCKSCNRPLGYERVYLPLCQVADTPFHIQGDDIMAGGLTLKPLSTTTVVLIRFISRLDRTIKNVYKEIFEKYLVSN